MSGARNSSFASSKFSLSTYVTYSGANVIDQKYSSIMRTTAAAAAWILAAGSLMAQTAANDVRARDIFKQLIEINTTDSVGNVTTAANAMAARLKAAGFPPADIQVIGPDPRKGNLVLRWRGASSTGARKAILLLAHLDVVEAKREDWSFDPFVFLEKDGFF